MDGLSSYNLMDFSSCIYRWFEQQQRNNSTERSIFLWWMRLVFSEGRHDDAEQHEREEGPERAKCCALQQQPCGEGQSGGEGAADERAGER